MSVRGKTRAHEIQLGFEALSIEGGLLSPEWLSRVAQLAAGGQNEGAYRIPKGLNLRDEIGRYWRIAQAHWSELCAGRSAKADPRLLSERFVRSLLRDTFGFESLTNTDPVVIAERSYPIGFSALGGRIPVVIAPVESGLDTVTLTFGDGGRRRSAFGLAQEYLNAQDGALWGLVCDGVTLRIARDNASLTRPAWIEADLQRIFTEERYADFAAFWLLAHETRFGRADQAVDECALETWRNAGREEGTRAREHLRRGVEDALAALGQGFLSCPENQTLRSELQNGTLSTKEYFNQLLRLVYRLIFLLTVEERGLLHPEGTDQKAKTLYGQGYGLRRLRERSVKRSAHDRFSDLWESTKVAFLGVSKGEPRLGLPALSGIFGNSQCPALDAARLENRALLLAVFKLAWLREDSSLVRVNWRDMGPEELGSVYESLLELVPQITTDGRQFAFATGGESKGNARKTTGSYYTPDSLVQALLDSALDPVIADTIARNPHKPDDALLGLAIVDPACGSGHFLLAAARRLASHVARMHANGTPSAAEYRHALRQVVGRCIYGVDLNPMAVELCKVSLWMEAVEPGLPLTFLNSHIQHGNALLGTTPELMAKGIPDTAWECIDGDDTKTTSGLKKRNRSEAGGQRSLDFWSDSIDLEAKAIARAVAELEVASDANPEALARKESHWDRILVSPEYQHQKFVADTWCGAFVWPKQPGELADEAPTNGQWRGLRDRQLQPPSTLAKTVSELAEQYNFFHWHLQFPHVFANGGFDVVIGNPPWDSVRFNEEEFFAGPRPDIARAPTAAARKRLISKLAVEDPILFAAYRKKLREINGANALVRSGVRFPLCGVGRVNLFALFAEAARSIVRQSGRVGQILPSGIVSDDSTKLFFQAVVDSGQLVCFFDFENREGLFPAIDSRIRFGIFVLAGEGRPNSSAEFVFFATRVEQLVNPERRFRLSAEDIALLNPRTKTCPIFRSSRDAEITKAVYRRVPILAASEWKLDLKRLINQSDDSASFKSEAAPGLLPLYEGKYFHHYDHRWVTNDGQDDRPLTEGERLDPNYQIRSRHWFPADDAQSRFGVKWKHSWVLAWRDITNATNERTFIAAVIPSLAVPNTAKVIFPTESQIAILPDLIANIGTFAFDFVARQKVGGTHMATFITEQLPILTPGTYQAACPWSRHTCISDWLRPRVLELTYTAWDLEPFARDMGHEGPPFRWDPLRRFVLRCELDAAFFHLYALSRHDTDFIIDSFPIVRKHDEKLHGGSFRTKEAIIEIYDAMSESIRNGQSYQTRVNPPPADPGAAHELRVPEIPTMPGVIPALPPDQEAAILVWALLHAQGGTILRIDLARAFALRARPDLLVKFAPTALAQTARIWAAKVGQKDVASGLLAKALAALSDRSGVDLTTDASSRSAVKVNRDTPSDDQIDPWFRFEARLALHVLRSQPGRALSTIDAAVTGGDRALLKQAS